MYQHRFRWAQQDASQLLSGSSRWRLALRILVNGAHRPAALACSFLWPLQWIRKLSCTIVHLGAWLDLCFLSLLSSGIQAFQACSSCRIVPSPLLLYSASHTILALHSAHVHHS